MYAKGTVHLRNKTYIIKKRPAKFLLNRQVRLVSIINVPKVRSENIKL